LILPFPRKQLPKPPNDSKLLPPHKTALTPVITNQRAADEHPNKMALILKILWQLLAAPGAHLWRTDPELCDSYSVFTPPLQNLLPAVLHKRT
jgi:hypothetical protein